MTIYYKALDLDGINDYVDCGDDAATRISNNLSVMTCIYVDGSQPKEKQILTKYNWMTEDYRTWSMCTGFSTNQRFRVLVFAASGAWADRKDYETKDDVLTAGWHMVGFTFVSGVLKLIVDGVEQTVNKFSDYTVNTLYSGANSPVVMASRGTDGTPDGFLACRLCNTSIWDTAVLSEANFATLWGSGTPTDPADLTPAGGGSLVASWCWNTAITYPTIPDNTGSSDGTMTNMTAGDIVDSPWAWLPSTAVRPFLYNRATKTSDGSYTSWLSPSPNSDTLMTYHPDALDPADYTDFVVTGGV